MRNLLVFAAFLLVLVSCSSDASVDTRVTTTTAPATTTTTLGATTTTAPAATTTTLGATTTTTLGATTTTAPAATTTTLGVTTTTAPDLSTPCGVVEAWVLAAAAQDWVATWDLTHPFTQTGIPLESPNGGYAAGGSPSPSNVAYQDETALSTSPWATVTDRSCSFFPFGSSWSTDVGIVTLSGTDSGVPLAAAYEVRTDSGQWKIDNFSIFISIEVPQLGVPIAPADPIWFKTPLGTMDVAVLVDGVQIPTTLDEHPTDLDAGRVTGTPPAPLASGTHVLTVIAGLENGVVDALAYTFEVN